MDFTHKRSGIVELHILQVTFYMKEESKNGEHRDILFCHKQAQHLKVDDAIQITCHFITWMTMEMLLMDFL